MNCRTHLNIDISNAHCGPWRNIQDHSCLRAGCIKTNTTLSVPLERAGRTLGGSDGVALRCDEIGPFKYCETNVSSVRVRRTAPTPRRLRVNFTFSARERRRRRARGARHNARARRTSTSTYSRRTRRPKGASTWWATRAARARCVCVRDVAAPTDIASASIFYRWPQIREDHPPNLSILVSGGKETNKDFLSSGERTGNSPALNPAVVSVAGDVVFGRFRFLVVAAPVQVRLERGRLSVEGARPVVTVRGGERDSPQSRVA